MAEIKWDEQRVNEIRARRAKEYGHSFTGTVGTDAAMADIDYLLAQIDNAVAAARREVLHQARRRVEYELTYSDETPSSDPECDERVPFDDENQQWKMARNRALGAIDWACDSNGIPRATARDEVRDESISETTTTP
jgi:hypothetical protein